MTISSAEVTMYDFTIEMPETAPDAIVWCPLTSPSDWAISIWVTFKDAAIANAFLKDMQQQTHANIYAGKVYVGMLGDDRIAFAEKVAAALERKGLTVQRTPVSSGKGQPAVQSFILA